MIEEFRRSEITSLWFYASKHIATDNFSFLGHNKMMARDVFAVDWGVMMKLTFDLLDIKLYSLYHFHPVDYLDIVTVLR